MKKYFLLAFVSFVIIFLVMFANFGGFKSVEYSEKTDSKITVVGKLFEGKANSSAFGNAFKEMDKLGKNHSNLVLTAVYLENPIKENNYSVKAFIGLSGNLENVSFQNLEKRTFEYPKTIMAQKEAHPLLTRLSLSIDEYAKAKNYTLDPNIRIEYYYGERNMALEVPYSISSN